jgi:hypothetical protein
MITRAESLRRDGSKVFRVKPCLMIVDVTLGEQDKQVTACRLPWAGPQLHSEVDE